MHQSMTGFAPGQGSKGPHSWSWDLRSVNAKGLDIRIRVPDWLTGLEAQLKSRLTEAVARGNVTLGLPITREDTLLAMTQKKPVALVPAHWAPMRIHFYTGSQFPEMYRNAAFVAFHAGRA